MTEQDLLAWGLEHYFSVIRWAVDRAKNVLDESGMDAAVEYLRKVCSEGGHGGSGPGKPSYATRGGKVFLWQPESAYGEPDLAVDLLKFCRWKLESLHQLKLM